MTKTVPLMKDLGVSVPNGELKIKQSGGGYFVEYHNPIYVNSPFIMPTTFNSKFTIEEILNSRELQKFIARFS
jgi:hypothetical protein